MIKVYYETSPWNMSYEKADTPEEAEKLVKRLKKAGFNNIHIEGKE